MPALAGAGFVLAWFLLHHGPFTHGQMRDTVVYAHYSHLMLDRGRVPYRNFHLEYPPLSLPTFLIPGLVAGRHFWVFQRVFELLMAGCGAIAVGLAVFGLSRQRVSNGRLAASIALGVSTPLLIGTVILSRYDLWPALLTIGALAAIGFDRPRAGFALLALGVAAKGYPIVLLPIAAVYVWRGSGRRQALVCLGIFAALLLAVLLPFAILSPHGLWASIRGQVGRPMQIESLGASIWLAAHQLLGTHVSTYFTHGSDNINGHPAAQFATVMSVLQLAALVFVFVVFLLGPATRQRLLFACAAAVCAFITFDRVLSPQYLLWLLPLVMLLPGRRGLAATGLLALAMVLTQSYFPQLFPDLRHFQSLPSWAVIARNVVLLGLMTTLAWPDVSIVRSALRRVRALRFPSAVGRDLVSVDEVAAVETERR